MLSAPQAGRILHPVFAAIACAIFVTLLLSIRQIDRVPELIIVVLFGLAAVSAWRPAAGLMILALLVPIASWLGRYWWTVAWPEALVVAFAAGFSARAIGTAGERHDDLDPPLWTLAALVIASLVVRVFVLHWALGSDALKLQFWELATADYFVKGRFAEVDAAMRLLEGLLLLRASASASQSNPAFVPRLASWFVAGAAAAAALNVWRIWQSAVRTEDPLSTLLGHFVHLRYNVHYPDVNAAGSYFVMALLAAIGLTIATKPGRWIAPVVLIASSLMLSGSRAAALAGALAALLWAGWRLKGALGVRQPHTRTLAISVLILIGCAIAAISYASMRRNLTPASTALRIRAEFARTTLRMVETYPVFGVGIGQYLERSGGFSSPVLVDGFGLGRENAHNNFLQILGELGILGFGVFLWLLWVAARRSLRVLDARSDALREGIIAGLLSFSMTWLSGHPLLVDEPSFSFWLLCGMAAGWRGESPFVRFSSFQRGAAIAVACAVLALSIPSRARDGIANAYLEHQSIGLTGWRLASDGKRYRLAGASSTLFVPSDARAVTIPLQSAQPGTELVVSFDLNGRRADSVRVSSGRWHDVRLVLPADGNAPRFSRVDFRVDGALPEDVELLMIGRVNR